MGCFEYEKYGEDSFWIVPPGEGTWQAIYNNIVRAAIITQVPFEDFREHVPGGIHPEYPLPAIVRVVSTDPGTCYPSGVEITFYDRVYGDGSLRAKARASAAVNWIQEWAREESVIQNYLVSIAAVYQQQYKPGDLQDWEPYLNQLANYLHALPWVDSARKVA